MKLTKKYIIPTMFMLGVILIGLTSVSPALAQEDSQYSSIITKIAEKFNLNPSDVQAVFEEEKNGHKADMYARLVEKLDSMIGDGKITKEQKETILKKHEEIENKMLEMQGKTPEERKTEMEALRSELKSWAEEQGIESPLFMMRGGGHKGKFMKARIAN